MRIITMKFISAICFSILAFAIPQANAQVCSPAPVGLVSWYSGDGNALDSRSRNNATPRGGATFAAGQNGQAFSINGVTGSAFIAPDNPTLELSSLTLETWIRVDGLPQSGRLGAVIFRGDDEAFRDPYYLATLPNGKLRFHIETALGAAEDLETDNPIPLAQFIHVAGTFDANSGEMRIYVNGVLAAPVRTTAVRPRLQLNNALNPGIGIGNIGSTSNATVLDQIFNGLIDEPAIYNRALSASEIQAIAGAGTAGKCKPTATTAPSGQVAWLAGDGNAGDIAGTNNGTLNGNAGFVVGKVGQGFIFDGTDDFIEIPNNAALSPTTISLEAWVKPDSINIGSRIISKDVSTTSCNSPFIVYSLETRGEFGGRAAFFYTLTDNVPRALQSTTIIPTNSFSHIAATYDGTTARIYVNGVLENSQTVSGTLRSSTAPTIIGNSGAACRPVGGNTSGFDGIIDEVSLYNRALTDAEITSIVNAGIAGKLKQNAAVETNSLISLYQGENNANDTRGFNNASFANTYAAGQVGQAFNFTAQNQFVDIPNNAAYFPTNTITAEAWVNPSTFTGCNTTYRIVHTVQAQIRGWLFGLNCSGTVYAAIFNNSSQENSVTTTVAVPTGRFTHVAFTWDGSNLRLYINGVLNNTAATTITALGSNTDNLRIGNATNFGFVGQIDEVGIYNRTLTVAQIRANYEAGNALSTVVGDARVSASTVPTAATIQQIPLLASLFPALPSATHTGLIYDIASSVSLSSPTVCFNLPSFTPTQFTGLRIFHLEAGVWQPRTAGMNTFPTLCTTGLPSLSPFAIGFNAPTAANVSIGGRVRSANGKGIFRAQVSLTDAYGNTRSAVTDFRGRYHFDDVPAGETYIISASHRFTQFAQNTQVRFIGEDDFGIDFVAE